MTDNRAKLPRCLAQRFSSFAGPARAEASFDSLFERKIDLHQNVLLLKHFEYRRALGYVGLVFVVRTLFTSLDVHSVPA